MQVWVLTIVLLVGDVGDPTERGKLRQVEVEGHGHQRQVGGAAGCGDL